MRVGIGASWSEGDIELTLDLYSLPRRGELVIVEELDDLEDLQLRVTDVWHESGEVPYLVCNVETAARDGYLLEEFR